MNGCCYYPNPNPKQPTYYKGFDFHSLFDLIEYSVGYPILTWLQAYNSVSSKIKIYAAIPLIGLTVALSFERVPEKSCLHSIREPAIRWQWNRQARLWRLVRQSWRCVTLTKAQQPHSTIDMWTCCSLRRPHVSELSIWGSCPNDLRLSAT